MKTFFFLFTFLFASLQAQLNIILPDSFNIIVNDKVFNQEKSWLDSLKIEAQSNKIYYHLGAHYSNGRITQTKLRIPQTFNFGQLIRQVIIYFSLLNSETERENETVLIYPYFLDNDKTEFVKCVYTDKSFIFTKKKWDTILIDSPPTPEEKFIYNQILNTTMRNTLTFEEIPENAIKEISIIQKQSYEKILQIYKKVILWNTRIP